MGEHTEKQFVYLKQKQGRDTHQERKGVGILPNEEECTRKVIQITYMWGFFPVFVYLRSIISFLFHIWPVLGPSLTCVRIFLPRWIQVQRPMGRLTPPIMGWHPPPLAPKETFCACRAREVSLTSRMSHMWSLYLLSKQDSAPPCSCSYLYLRVFVHRGRIPAIQPGAQLSPASVSFMKIWNRKRAVDKNYKNLNKVWTSVNNYVWTLVR